MKWIDPCVIVEADCASWKHGKCNICIDHFGCVAFYWKQDGERVGPQIDEAMCTGCQLCFQVCPLDAIEEVEEQSATGGER